MKAYNIKPGSQKYGVRLLELGIRTSEITEDGVVPIYVQCKVTYKQLHSIQLPPRFYYVISKSGTETTARTLQPCALCIARGGCKISLRGGLPVMNWCLNAIEWCILNRASPSQWAPASTPTHLIRACPLCLADEINCIVFFQVLVLCFVVMAGAMPDQAAKIVNYQANIAEDGSYAAT